MIVFGLNVQVRMDNTGWTRKDIWTRQDGQDRIDKTGRKT